jgi:hypothetical protein
MITLPVHGALFQFTIALGATAEIHSERFAGP